MYSLDVLGYIPADFIKIFQKVIYKVYQIGASTGNKFIGSLYIITSLYYGCGKRNMQSF